VNQNPAPLSANHVSRNSEEYLCPISNRPWDIVLAISNSCWNIQLPKIPQISLLTRISLGQVVGSTGQPFVQLSPNSMTISTNGATDLVAAQIELPINQATLDQNGITADNTFVAKLSSDGQAWIVMEGIKSVNT